MGQYHEIHNLTRNVRYSPRAVGSSIKLMEQGLTISATATLLYLAANDWKGERLALIGDYAEPGDLPAADLDNAEHAEDIGEAVLQTMHAAKIIKSETTVGYNGHVFTSSKVRATKERGAGPKAILLNLDKRQSLTPTLLGDAATMDGVITASADGGTGTALTILLAVSCKGGARGGGDFNNAWCPLVGGWGGDRIALVGADDELASGEWHDITLWLREEIEAGTGVQYMPQEDGTVVRGDFGG